MTHRTSSTVHFSRGSTIGPQTPTQNQAISFGSPSILRAEEECIIIELGSRFLRAGLAGWALPQVIADFGPEQQRRAGDLRRWDADYDGSCRSMSTGKRWGKDYELWPLDLREVDYALIGDKLERALRHAFTKTLLIDSRPRRMILAIPSLLPLPLLFTVLETLFSDFQPPSISLMSTPILTAVAAGVRSAIVVDIGWAETTVTSVYEFREVQCSRSVRASQLLGETVFNQISKIVSNSTSKNSQDISETQISFEECEEIVERMLWCKSIKNQGKSSLKADNLTNSEKDDLKTSAKSCTSADDEESDGLISLPLRSIRPPKIIQIPFSVFSEPCEIALFASGIPESDLDDEELPLHILIYRSLLKLPVDVRAMCMARIIFVGGASQIPGLKTRVMQEICSLIETRGWSLVSGKAVEQLKKNLQTLRAEFLRRPKKKWKLKYNTPLVLAPSASCIPQESDPITDKLKRESRKGRFTVEKGKLRAVNSLGAWAGASLMSLMKIQPNLVIEKDQWAQNGATKISRIDESSLSTQRQSMGSETLRSGVRERSSWTLGIWS